jgi:hypothetical protein
MQHEFSIIFIFIHFGKYAIVSKLSKTNLPQLWPMAVGANRHGPRRFQVLQRLTTWPTTVGTVAPATAVAHGG